MKAGFRGSSFCGITERGNSAGRAAQNRASGNPRFDGSGEKGEPRLGEVFMWLVIRPDFASHTGLY